MKKLLQTVDFDLAIVGNTFVLCLLASFGDETLAIGKPRYANHQLAKGETEVDTLSGRVASHRVQLYFGR